MASLAVDARKGFAIEVVAVTLWRAAATAPNNEQYSRTDGEEYEAVHFLLAKIAGGTQLSVNWPLTFCVSAKNCIWRWYGHSG